MVESTSLTLLPNGRQLGPSLLEMRYHTCVISRKLHGRRAPETFSLGLFCCLVAVPYYCCLKFKVCTTRAHNRRIRLSLANTIPKITYQSLLSVAQDRDEYITMTIVARVVKEVQHCGSGISGQVRITQPAFSREF